MGEHADHVIHTDDVEAFVIDRGDLCGRRRRLAAAAGATQVGLSRYDLGPGERPMPLHVHGAEEEIFHVLEGDGLITDGERSWRIAAGETAVHLAGGAPHTFVAGAGGLRALMFATGAPHGDLTWLPRPNVMWAGPRWLPLDGPHPFRAEADCGPLAVPEPEAERPPWIAPADAGRVIADERPGYRGTDRALAEAAGSVASGLRRCVLEPGQWSCPPHWHGEEEELFVILGGDGELLLMEHDLSERRVPVRAGSVVCRPPASGTAHALIAGDGGLTYLAYGTRRAGEIVYYPRSRKAYLGPVLVRVEPVADYWDGEERS